MTPKTWKIVIACAWLAFALMVLRSVTARDGPVMDGYEITMPSEGFAAAAGTGGNTYYPADPEVREGDR